MVNLSIVCRLFGRKLDVWNGRILSSHRPVVGFTSHHCRHERYRFSSQTTNRYGYEKNHNKNDSNNVNTEQDYTYPRPKHIPAPSWSIQDLELDKKHPSLPGGEIERLSKLALIDISSMSKEEQESLNQDLANMIHMIQQVTNFEYNNNNNNNNNKKEYQKEDNDIDIDKEAHSIYDKVRGLSATIPLRNSIDEDSFQEVDTEQAEQVWQHLLQPKTIRKGGGHEYFVITTGEEKNDGKEN